jgi:hypothetical protein
MVGWSLSLQDNKTINKIKGISSTLPLDKARYSNKAKTAFAKHHHQKTIFWRECSFPFATIFCCLIKMAFHYFELHLNSPAWSI